MKPITIGIIDFMNGSKAKCLYCNKEILFDGNWYHKKKERHCWQFMTKFKATPSTEILPYDHAKILKDVR